MSETGGALGPAILGRPGSRGDLPAAPPAGRTRAASDLPPLPVLLTTLRPEAPAPRMVDAAALADFLASLAHALRTPLGVVSGAVTELRADLVAQMSEEDRLLVTLADRGLRRLGHIADTVSLAAALDSGTLELCLWPVDLVELLRGAAAASAAIEPRREVEVACDLPSEQCPIRADAGRLSRAVSELLINAVRHARRRTRLHLELRSGSARVTIEDDGEGVPEARQATLFRRFGPLPSRSGLGMGLSLAHDVILAHGGRLALEASTLPPGRPGTTGARFMMSLPLDGGARAA